MRQAKEYLFKSRSLIFEGLMALLSFGPLAWMSFTLYDKPLILLFIGIVPGILCYFQLYTIYITSQFNKYDKGKKVVISNDRSVLTLIQFDLIVEINRENVERVEIFNQKSLGKFGTFDYIIIYTIDKQELLITQFTIPGLVYDNILQSFLRKKPRIYTKRTFNFIKQPRFLI